MHKCETKLSIFQLSTVLFCLLTPSIRSVAAGGHEQTSADAAGTVDNTELTCEEQWKEWRQKYASANPYANFNKMNRSPIGDEQVRAALNVQQKIVLNTPIKTPGGEIREIDLGFSSSEDEAFKRQLEIARHAAYGRNGFLPALIYQTVRKSSDDTLVIVSTGTNHALDFYHWFPEMPAMYIGQRSDGATYFSDDFYRFYNALGANGQEHLLSILGEEDPTYTDIKESTVNGKLEKIHSDPSENIRYYLRRIAINGGRFARKPTEAVVSDKTVPRSNLIIWGEHHLLNEQSALNDLPDADCLRELGFNKVLVLKEGLPYSKQSASPDDFKNMFLSFLTNKFRAHVEEKVKNDPDTSIFALMFANEKVLLEGFKGVSPEAGRLLESGKVSRQPSTRAVFDTYRDLKTEGEAKGLAVSMMGMDFDRSSLQEVKISEMSKHVPFNVLLWVMAKNRLEEAIVDGEEPNSDGMKRLLRDLVSAQAGLDKLRLLPE